MNPVIEIICCDFALYVTCRQESASASGASIPFAYILAFIAILVSVYSIRKARQDIQIDEFYFGLLLLLHKLKANYETVANNKFTPQAVLTTQEQNLLNLQQYFNEESRNAIIKTLFDNIFSTYREIKHTLIKYKHLNDKVYEQIKHLSIHIDIVILILEKSELSHIAIEAIPDFEIIVNLIEKNLLRRNLLYCMRNILGTKPKDN